MWFRSIRTLTRLATLLLALPVLAAPAWPDLSTQAPVQGGGEADAAVVVALEHSMAVPAIPGASDNAQDWYLWLTRTRKVPVANVTLLRDGQATREKMKKALTEAKARAGASGTLWFVFIGHGAPSRDGKEGVLVGFDAQQDVDSLTERSLAQSEALEAVRGGRQAHAVFVLDACFSGRAASGELVRGLQPVVALRPMAVPAAVTVLTAGTSDQFAGPLPGVERPAFSYLVLGALRGWGDANGDGQVSGAEAVTYAQDALQALLTDRTQTPQLSGASADRPLARGVEVGPDLAALVLAQRSRSLAHSEMRFGGASAEVKAPKTPVAADRTAGRVPLEAEQLVEQARETEASKTATPEKRAEAWCRLARLTVENPYQAQAQTACARWLGYSASLSRQELGVTADLQALGGYLRLEGKTKAQRVAAAKGFLTAWASLAQDERVKGVEQGLALLESDQAYQPPDGTPALEARCTAQEPRACLVLGSLRLQGTWPLAKDEAQGVALISKACDAPLPAACTLLAKSLEKGLGTAQNVGAAAATYQKACDSYDATACRALSAMSAEGRGVPRSLERAAQLSARGCQIGDDASCSAQGWLLVDGVPQRNDALAMVLFEGACARGESSGCEGAGTLARDGRAGPRDLALGAARFDSACTGGRVTACVAGGALYERLNDERAVKLFERACVLGDAQACAHAKAVPVKLKADAERVAGQKTLGVALLGAGAVLVSATGVLVGLGLNGNAQVRGGGLTRAEQDDVFSRVTALNVASYATLAAGAVALAAGSHFLASSAAPAKPRLALVPLSGGGALALLELSPW